MGRLLKFDLSKLVRHQLSESISPCLPYLHHAAEDALSPGRGRRHGTAGLRPVHRGLRASSHWRPGCHALLRYWIRIRPWWTRSLGNAILRPWYWTRKILVVDRC